MATKLQVVQRALGKIGLGTYVFDPSPEQLAAALDQLNDMAAEMDGVGLRKGYNFGTEISAESGLFDTAVGPYSTLLAIRLAPDYGKQLAPSLAIAGKAAMSSLMIANNVIPPMLIPSTLPIGTGNRISVRDRAYFPTVDPLAVPDGEITY